MLEDDINLLMSMSHAISTNEFAFVGNDLEKLLPGKPLSLEEYLKEI
ncbi:hypothetical protein [Pedobacter sp. KLB.chiD]